MLTLLAYRSSRPALRLTVSVTRKYSAVLPSEPPKKSKVWDSVDEAVGDINSGDVLLCGGVWYFIGSLFTPHISTGFGAAGIPGP
jgi:hypothetical protein